MNPLVFKRYANQTFGFPTVEFHIVTPSINHCPWWVYANRPIIKTEEELFNGQIRTVQRYMPDPHIVVKIAPTAVLRDQVNWYQVGERFVRLDLGADPRHEAVMAVGSVPSEEVDREFLLTVLSALRDLDISSKAVEGGTSSVSKPSTEDFPSSLIVDRGPIYETPDGVRFREPEIDQLEAMKIASRRDLEAAMRATGTRIKRMRKNHAKST